MIDTPVLRQLARLGALDNVVARQVPGGFVVVVQHGLEEDELRAQRGGARTFRHLDTVCSFLGEVGIRRFTVEVADFGSQAALRL
jgi:hypothetical protein